MKKLVFALLMTVLLVAPAFSQMTGMSMNDRRGEHGQMTGMHDMDMMGSMMGICVENAVGMGLTDDQITKMKSLHREMMKKQARFKADQKIARIDLMEIMDVKDFDLDKASAAVKKLGDMRTAQHLEMLRAMKQMRSILTEEQFKKMRSVMFMKMSSHKRMMNK